jgi:hypothetical protein
VAKDMCGHEQVGDFGVVSSKKASRGCC